MFSTVLRRVGALSKRSSLRSVSVLMSGTIGGQAIIALSAPVLTRIYSPDEMGALNVFTSIASPILAFASLRFNSALQVPEDQEEARSLAHMALASVLFVAIMAFFVVLFFRHEIATFFTTPNLSQYLFLLPLTIVGAGVFATMSSWCVRVKEFSLIARARLRQSFAIVAAQIVLGLGGLGSWGLVSGDATGRFVGSLGQFRLFLATSPKGEPIQRDYWALLKRYKHFPLYSVPPALMNSASINLPTYYLAAVHGPGAVGLYALGQRVLGVPLNLIADAVSQVFLSQAAEMYRKSVDQLAARTRLVCLLLMSLGAAIVIPIAVFGPWAFGLVFGERWYDAGVYVRALAPMLWAQFSFSPLSAVLIPLERQDLFALRETIRMILLGGTIGVMMLLNVTDPVQIVRVFGLVGALTYVIGGGMVWYSLRSAKRKSEKDAEINS